MVQAVTVSRVLDVWYPTVVKKTVDKTVDRNVRHAFLVIIKASITIIIEPVMREVTERCGAQGAYLREEAQTLGTVD